MKCNVGGVDRTGRVVLGIVLLLVGLLVPGIGTAGRVALLVIAAVGLVTAMVRYCPGNALFGIDTCGMDRKSGGESAHHGA